MDIAIILSSLKSAIEELLATEKNTLERGLHEETISAKLYEILRKHFVEYHVNHTYNGDIEKPNDRKSLEIARHRMLETRRKVHENDIYRVIPDIIIHRQGTNEHNLVVIEVKKDSSEENHKYYDLLKLEHMTIDYNGNHYNYKLGVALEFGTGKNTGTVLKKYYQNGIPLAEDKLVN